MSPLIHNAGFAEVGHNGVYLPLPIAADEKDSEASYASFKATVTDLLYADRPFFGGASVTIPHKRNAHRAALELLWTITPEDERLGAINTIAPNPDFGRCANTDVTAIDALLRQEMGDFAGRRVAVVGAGGVAVAAARHLANAGATVVVYNRTEAKARELAAEIMHDRDASWEGKAVAAALDLLPKACCDAFINCTPLGMKNGPDPSTLSIPIPDMTNITPDTIFFDTVYNPIETPMLKAAREWGCRTIDGVQMFVKQAAAQFELWTGKPAPESLFDRLVREKLGN